MGVWQEVVGSSVALRYSGNTDKLTDHSDGREGACRAFLGLSHCTKHWVSINFVILSFFDETETQRGHDCLPRVTGLGMAESCLTQFLSFQCFIVHTCLSPDPFPWTKACLPRCGWVKT